MVQLAELNEYSKQHVPNDERFKEEQRKSLKELLGSDFLFRETYLYWFLSLENDEDTEGLKKVIEVFTERCKVHWKGTSVMQWIKGYGVAND